MNITHKIENDISVITVSGKLNIENVIEFESHMDEIIENNDIKLIAVNCEYLSYVDSSGLGCWIQTLNKAKSKEKNFYLYNLAENILLVLEMAYLDKFFDISTTEKMKKKFKSDIF